MKKALIPALALLLLAGCATVSSMYTKARPNHVVSNADGTTTFEFLFKAEGIDYEMAADRVGEYLIQFAVDNGYSGKFELIDGNAAIVQSTSPGAAALYAASGFASGMSGSSRPIGNPPRNSYVRFILKIRFVE